jgi:hypothetical protein
MTIGPHNNNIWLAIQTRNWMKLDTHVQGRPQVVELQVVRLDGRAAL